MPEIALFLGAGASKPFGIPTMKDLVKDFEKELKKGTKEEIKLYRKIKNLLKKKYKEPVDLESVFTVIDDLCRGVYFRKWSDSAYFYYYRYLAEFFKDKTDRFLPPVEKYETLRFDDRKIARRLKSKFERFVKKKCVVKKGYFDKIDRIYDEFFLKLAGIKEIKINNRRFVVNDGRFGRKDGGIYARWPIFTTNYDTIIENYWQNVKVEINDGFVYDNINHKTILDATRFGSEHSLKLFKLHGSIDWKKEDDGTIVRYGSPPSTKKTFRRTIVVEDVMIYPISEKYMYQDPYLSMFYHMSNELQKSPCWIIIGYSLRDKAIKSVIRDALTKNPKKKIIIFHKKANQVINNELSDISGDIVPFEKKFGVYGVIDELSDILV